MSGTLAPTHIWARIGAGQFVIQIFTTPSTTAPALTGEWHDITDVLPLPTIGMQRNLVTTLYSAPVPAAPTPITKLSSNQFMALFTIAEQTAIVGAAMSNVALSLWYGKMLGADYVDLTDPQTKDGLDALVAAGLLTAAREALVLAGTAI